MSLWRAWSCALLLCSLGVVFAAAPCIVFAGDEDLLEAKPSVEPPTPPPEVVPAPTPPPAPEQEPDLGFQSEKPSTEPDIPKNAVDSQLQLEIPAPEKPVAESVDEPLSPDKNFDADKNIDYSEALEAVEFSPLEEAVLPPAVGFRGYRPNMIAASAGDRTPGYGGLLEYNWNRIGAGISYSYRKTNFMQNGALVVSQSFANLYGLYRWLPFAASPYFLLGFEAGSNTLDTAGAIAGIGFEAGIHAGWTILFGYTYHSIVHRGFMGGALGWSF